MAEPLAQLFVAVGADVDKAVAGLNSVNSSIDNFSTLSKAALPASAALAGVGVGIGAGFASAVGAATEFEAAMSGVKAVMTPVEVQQFGAALSALALTLGKDTTFTAREAAAGIEELVKAGIPAEAVLNGAAKAALALAAATGIDVAGAAEVAAQAMNAFKVPVEGLPGVVDHLAGTVNASAAGMNDLKFALQAVGAVASIVGLSFQDTATAIGLMANNGIKGSDAGTALKSMLLNLIPHTDKTIQKFNELGLSTFDSGKALKFLAEQGIKPADESLGSLIQGVLKATTGAESWNAASEKQRKTYIKSATEMGILSNQFFDAAGNIKSMSEIAGVLETALAGMTSQQKEANLQVLFGTDGFRAAAILATEGAAGVDKLAASIGKISASDAAKERLNNLSGSLKQLGGSVETLQITVGTKLTPAIRALADFLTGLTNAFLNLPEPVQTAIAAFIGIVGIVAALVGGIGLIAAGVGILVPSFVALGGVLAATGSLVVGLVILFAPLLATLGLLIAGVALVAIAWNQNWFDIQGKTAAVLSWLQENLGTILVVLAPLTAGLSLFAAAWVNNWFDIQGKTAGFIEALTGTLGNFGSFIQTGVLPYLQALADLGFAKLQAAAATLATFWTSTFLPALQATGDFFKQYVLPPFQALADLITTVIKPILDGLGTVLGPLGDQIKNIFGGVGANAAANLDAATKQIQVEAANTRAAAGVGGGTVVNGPVIGTVQIANEVDADKLIDRVADVFSGAETRTPAPTPAFGAGAF